MAGEFQEPGYLGVLVSLSGSKDGTGRGRQPFNATGTLTAAAAPVTVLQPNVKRLAAIIQNTGANDMRISLGAAAQQEWWWWIFPDCHLVLRPYSSFQIDTQFPWAGAVSAESDLGTSYAILEVSTG